MVAVQAGIGEALAVAARGTRWEGCPGPSAVVDVARLGRQLAEAAVALRERPDDATRLAARSALDAAASDAQTDPDPRILSEVLESWLNGREPAPDPQA